MLKDPGSLEVALKFRDQLAWIATSKSGFVESVVTVLEYSIVFLLLTKITKALRDGDWITPTVDRCLYDCERPKRWIYVFGKKDHPAYLFYLRAASTAHILAITTFTAKSHLI